jgi:hypothetical protein
LRTQLRMLLAAMMEAGAGKGLSIAPDDYFPDNPDPETIFWYADQYDRGWRTLYRRLLSGEVAA